ncbi:MAG: M28 family peptidase [SAR324 cluster bacterium]|nr:M28 family peptidase [SAR324 cluster bacterium]
MSLRTLVDSIDPVNLLNQFETICSFGGRVCGSDGEVKTIEFLKKELNQISKGLLSSRKLDYRCWNGDASVKIGNEPYIPAQALLFSPLTPEGGIVREVRDIGQGARNEFESFGSSELKGKIVLVRHSYMFSPSHVHRMQKYAWAREFGAAGFIIANPWPESGLVAGGIMQGDPDGRSVPGIGVDSASAILLSNAAQKKEHIRLDVNGKIFWRRAESLFFDLPGVENKWVAFSAHLDGHDLAESAIDNAGGVAILLELARIFSQQSKRQIGYRFCFFNLEEWGLLASEEYLKTLGEEEKKRILLNINLDAVVGDPEITALISDHKGLKEQVKQAAAAIQSKVNIHEPLTKNSDHYNFAESGIPALRLVAGFDNPESNLRFVLTEGDKRQLVAKEELVSACKIAVSLSQRV